MFQSQQRTIIQPLYTSGFSFERTFFGPNGKCLPLTPCFVKCHTKSRIFMRIKQTFDSARSFGVIFKLRFGGKGYFRSLYLIVCCICRGVDKKQISKWHNLPENPRKSAQK